MDRTIFQKLYRLTTARYFVIQTLGYGVDIGGFTLLYHMAHIEPLLANLASKAAAATLAFFGHRAFTFTHEQKAHIVPQAMKYIVLLVLNTAVNSAILAALLYLRAPTTPAKIGTDVSCVLATYFVMKHVVYRRPATPEPLA